LTRSEPPARVGRRIHEATFAIDHHMIKSTTELPGMERHSRNMGKFRPLSQVASGQSNPGLCLVLMLLCLSGVGPRALGDPATIASSPARQPGTQPAAADVYRTIEPSPDGIGKVYMGREIARVMGHLGAGWLERPEREREEQPRKAIELMEFRPTDVVADIGAGTGYFSFRIAEKVPKGKVLANDIQPEMLAMITQTAKEKGVANVEPILGTVEDPKLPKGAVDVVLMVDSYHEFDHPREMMLAIVDALKPDGRVIDVEYRGEDENVNILPHHKMTQAQAKKEMEAVGLKWVKTLDDLPQQHLMIFRKPRD
jgi:SAM-dependent methyltransferase